MTTAQSGSLAALSMMLAAMPGCKGGGSPTEAFNAFLDAVRRCDRDAIVAGMTAKTNQTIERTMRQMRALMPPDKVKDLDFYRDQICGQVKTDGLVVESVSVHGDKAVLKVRTGKAVDEVPMLREGGKWRLDFLGLMRGKMKVPPVRRASSGQHESSTKTQR